jgi:hypothetical protein
MNKEKRMSHKLVLSVVTIWVLVAISLGASIALAQKTQPVGETIPYPGHLSDDTGQPVPDGGYDFTFALYDAPDGGNLLWSETQSGVTVQRGTFVALLGSVNPLPQGVQSSSGRWLAVGVRGPGEVDFTALDQRQALGEAKTEATTAGTCAHTHFGEAWSGTGTGLALTSDGAGGETLFVNSTGNYDGIRASTFSTDASDSAVYGLATSSATGVSGSSNTGSGVEAASNSGAALNILQGAFKVTGAGINTATTVFIHQAHTGAGGNICPSLPNTTVIDHPLTNDDPNAILIITVNAGTMGSVIAPANPQIVVSFDTNNMCGFGPRWLIANLSYNPMLDGAKFNVLVVKP